MPRIINVTNGVPLYAENNLPFGDDLPLLCESMELLKSIKGKIITDILKLYNWEPSEYLNKPFNIPVNQLFKRALGPVFFVLENELCVGFYSSSLNQSVLVWREDLPLRFDVLAEKFQYIVEKGSLIDCRNKHFGDVQFANVIGRKITRLTIFKTSEPKTIPYRTERGLLVGLDNGTDFLISKGLQEKSSDFILMFDEKIRASLKDIITPIEV
ncbi:hypothetical protein [Undibacterium sp. TJN19]|uniref:hypothetical protein n=1 Tax=Undibacterium sp. TJN19 TaxID=3413055 RepID=UPI003BF05D57